MTFKQIEKILIKDGWYRYKVVGSHYQYKHNIKKAKITIPRYCKEIKKGVRNMKLIYPACFYEEKEGGYSVEIPDLIGCITQADNLESALEMAEDAALGWLLTTIEDGEEIPKSSSIKDIKLKNENGFVTLLLLDIDKYTEKYGTKKSVKKTLTIPEWLNVRAEKVGINFSKTLQEALLYKITNINRK